MKAVRWVIGVVFLFLAVGGSCARYSMWLDDQVSRNKDVVKQADDRITMIRADIPTITVKRDKVAVARRVMRVIPGFLKQVGTNTQRVAQLLDAVEKARPDSVTVTALNLQPGGQVLGFSLVADDVPCGGPPTGPPLLQLSAQAAGSHGRQALGTFQQALSHLRWCDRLEAGPVQASSQPAGSVQVQIQMRCKVLPE